LHFYTVVLIELSKVLGVSIAMQFYCLVKHLYFASKESLDYRVIES